MYIFKIYTEWVCIYIYIIKNRTQILVKQTFILDAINRDKSFDSTNCNIVCDKNNRFDYKQMRSAWQVTKISYKSVILILDPKLLTEKLTQRHCIRII